MTTPLIEPGIYEHYKGARYHVIEVGRHSETLDLYVVYRALYGIHGLWVRPLDMFFEEVLVEGVSVPRFRFLHTCQPDERAVLC